MSQDTKVQMQFRKVFGPSVKVKNCHAKPTSFSGAMKEFSPLWGKLNFEDIYLFIFSHDSFFNVKTILNKYLTAKFLKTEVHID